jgi:hypothetical protein
MMLHGIVIEAILAVTRDARNEVSTLCVRIDSVERCGADPKWIVNRGGLTCREGVCEK